MKKLIIYFFLLINIISASAVSIADFSVQYKNGKYFNFYDNPAVLFEVLNEKNTLDEIGIGNSNSYNFKECDINVFSRKFGPEILSKNEIRYLEEDFNVKNPDLYYAINYFEAYKNFSTIRGVTIGDDITKVLEKYPEAVLYKNNRKYKWNVSDCYHVKKIKKSKNLSKIGYVLIETANWQYNRSWEVDEPLHYELVFVIKDSKVKSIVMQCVLDAM